MSSFREYKDDIASRAHLVKDTVTQLPRIGIVVGTTVYVKENDTVYIWNGAGWYSIVEVEVVVPGWIVDVTQITYDSVSFRVISQDSFPYDLTFNSDGTKMYIVGAGTDTIYQYTLSTGFDISTASYNSVSFDVSPQDITPMGMRFNSDGTKMYIIGMATDEIHQYSLSTAFDLSTASYDSVSFSISSQDGTPSGIEFNPDGTKMYIVGLSGDSIYQYTLSTAYDVSTASYDSVSFSVSSEDAAPYGIIFNENGKKMYMTGLSSETIYQYSLSTAYDVSTASYDSVSFSVSSQDNGPSGIAFNPDGTKMYIVGYGDEAVYQYSTGL